MRFHLPILLAALAATAGAQLPTPSLDVIFPPGAPAGTTLEVRLSGTDLDGLKELRFSHEGIAAKPVMLPASPVWPEPRQDGTKFSVSIAPTVPAGLYEARSVSRYGISTSRIFAVSAKDAKEVVESGTHDTPETAAAIELNQVVIGNATDSVADYYKFAAKKDERVLVEVLAQRIDSRMDATLVLRAADGRELASVRDTIGLDPVLDFTAPADGEYVVGVHDFLYTGGEKHFYRLTASTAPRVDAIYPPAGVPGAKQQKFTLIGRNLPGGSPGEGLVLNGQPLETKEVLLDIPTESQPIPLSGRRPMAELTEGFNYTLEGANAIRVGFAKATVVEEDAKAAEQKITVPCEIAGRFDEEGDMDLFRFTAKKGDVLWIEAISDRMAVSADPSILVQQITTDAAGVETAKLVKETDDFPVTTTLITVDTNSRDGGLAFTAPADGDYRVVVSDNFGGFGPLRIYRLGIRPAKPDFKLMALNDRSFHEAKNAYPGAGQLLAGGTVGIRVVALREDGFDGPINLSVSGLPEGVTCPPAAIWQGASEGRLVLSATPEVKDWAGILKIEGSAQVGDAELKRPAVAGTLSWGAVDTAKERVQSRRDANLALAVTAIDKALVSLAPAEDKVWEVEMGKDLDLPVKLTKSAGIKGALTITPEGLPNFKKPPTLSVAEKDAQGVLKISFKPDAQNTPAPGEGRFVIRVDGVTKYQVNPQAVEQTLATQKKIEETAKQLAEAKTKADAAVKTADTELAAAKKAQAAAMPAADKAVADAQAKADAAKKAATDAAALVTQAEAAKTQIAAEAKTKADAALKTADTELATAKKAQAEAKIAADKAVADAQAKADAAKKAATEAAALVTQAEAAKKQIAAEAKAAADRAKEKDVKFTVYSLPVALKIVEAPKK